MKKIKKWKQLCLVRNVAYLKKKKKLLKKLTAFLYVLYCAVLCWVTQLYPILCHPWTIGLLWTWDFPGKNTGVGCHALLRGVFLTQGLNPGLTHCRQILYHLSHQGSPRILEWVDYPFSRETSQPRNGTGGSPALQEIVYQLSYQGSPCPLSTFKCWFPLTTF